MKKTLLILMAFVLAFTSTFLTSQQRADALTGKVISIAAKKIAKEVIKDAAFQSVGNLALKYAVPELSAKFKTSEGFKLVCLPGGKISGDCTKPVQIKADLTSVEKKNLGNVVELELEKAINHGKGFTKFMKFVDWLVPIFLIGLTITAISYALDPDVQSLFDEVATNALKASGLMKEVPLQNDGPIIQDKNGNPVSYPKDDPITINVPSYKFNTYTDSKTVVFSKTNSYDSEINMIIPGGPLHSDSVFTVDRKLQISEPLYDTYDVGLFMTDSNDYEDYLRFTKNSIIIRNKGIRSSTLINLYENGKFVREGYGSNSSNEGNINISSYNYDLNDLLSIKVSNVMRNSDSYFTNLRKYYIDFKGKNLVVTVESTDFDFNTVKDIRYYENHSANSNTNLALRLNYFASGQVYEPIPFVPELPDLGFSPLDHSIFKQNELVTLLPPGAFPYKQISTGYPLIVNPNNPDEFIDPNGNPVPDTDIEVGDPTIIENPDGSTSFIPPPSTANPSPSPVPIVPPKDPTGGNGSEDGSIPGGKPNGKINFKPLILLSALLRDKFPFSIPWDVFSLFGQLNVQPVTPVFKIDTNKSIDLGGKSIPIKYKFEIDFSFFDSIAMIVRWVLILVFDIAIILALRRLTPD